MGMEGRQLQKCVIMMVEVLVILFLLSSSHSAVGTSLNSLRRTAAMLREASERLNRIEQHVREYENLRNAIRWYDIHRQFPQIDDSEVGIHFFNALPSRDNLTFFIIDTVSPPASVGGMTPSKIHHRWGKVAFDTISQLKTIPASQNEDTRWKVQLYGVINRDGTSDTRRAEIPITPREGGKIKYYHIHYPSSFYSLVDVGLPSGEQSFTEIDIPWR